MKEDRRMSCCIAAAMLLLAASLGGCREESDEPSWEAPKRPIEATAQLPKGPERQPFQFDPNAEYEAVVQTSIGEFRLGFYADETPKTVENFVRLAAEWRFYDGQVVFRAVPDDYIQTGDPDGTGLGGPGERFDTIREKDLAEFTQRKFIRGTVGLARRPDNPYSATSQWFVCLRRRPQSDAQRVAFGYVKEGIDVVERISRVEVEGDRAVHWSRRQRPVEPPVVERVTIVEVGKRAVQASVEGI